MTQPNRPSYESTNRRYLSPAAGRDRKRTKLCPEDRVEFERTGGWLYCPTCGKTADELAQVTL